MTHLHSGEASARIDVAELVVNWHITEACNYRCRYCYAKWEGNTRELLHDVARSEKLVDNIAEFFQQTNGASPLRDRMQWSGIRLNLAGGEPLLYADETLHLLTYAKSKGLNTSLITNGSRLTPDLIDRLAPLVSLLGISIDSPKRSTNIAIGRTDSRSLAFDPMRACDGMVSLVTLIERARAINPSLRLKVNTVVNARNQYEDMSSVIRALDPQRWKVLRMLPTVTSDLAASDDGFSSFVLRHQAFADRMCVEDNDDMNESYIMIDPHGRFYQNSKHGAGYRYSSTTADADIAAAFASVAVSVNTYASRYLKVELPLGEGLIMA